MEANLQGSESVDIMFCVDCKESTFLYQTLQYKFFEGSIFFFE